MKKKPPYVDYKPFLIERLKNPVFAQGYLNATLQDEDRGVFLLALSDVVEAYGGMSKVARAAKISREHIYRMLSEKGNPELKTLKNLLGALGLKLAIETKDRNQKAA
jgi:probable addiction module antidote protein